MPAFIEDIDRDTHFENADDLFPTIYRADRIRTVKVLDRLPAAEILHEKEGEYGIRAEVFGKGIEMWLRSQGDYIQKIEK